MSELLEGILDRLSGVEGFAALAVLAWLAYLVSRLLKGRRLPELVAFLLVGAFLGPSALGVITRLDLNRLKPVTELALAVLMFMIGERVGIRALRAARWISMAGILQYLFCGTAVYFLTKQVGAADEVALLLAVMAGSGGPMTVASVVSSVRAKGSYAEGLVGTHAAGDALTAIAFAAALPVAILQAGAGGDVSEAVLQFLRLGAGGAVLGIVLGWVVGRLGQQIETSGELLLFVLVHIFLAWTVSQALGLSLPLAALIMGSAAASLTSSDTAQRIFVAVRGIEQPLYLLFFALAGASIHLDAIGSLGLLGAAYIVARVAGKLVGGFAGGWAGGLPWRRAARLGFDLTPQAGVAVGLAVLTAEVIPIPGADVAAVVLSSVVVFELLGPLIVARGLSRFVEAPQEAGALRVSSGLPTQVLIASPNRLQAPSWLLDLCSRGGAGLTALGPGDGNDEDTEKLRSDAGGANVSFKWVPLTSESFAGAVVRTASLSGADLVVVLTPIQAMRDWSRLVLHPHERIARQLTCPVIFLPYGTPDPEVAGVK